MATSLRELGFELEDSAAPANGTGRSVPADPAGVKQALVGHSFRTMREKNNDLRSHNQQGVIALMGFGIFFLSLFLFTQQTEGDVFLAPWRWGLVGLGTLAAWGLFFSGFAALFFLIYGAGARTGGLVRRFIEAFDQYEVECYEDHVLPLRGPPFTGRVTPSTFYGAAYCLLGSSCVGLGLYCWALVLISMC